MITLGNCQDVLKDADDNYYTTIITDPPYGLSFMGKKWDYEIPSVEIWKECLRVLKPGGTLLCFAGTRTQHRMTCNIEDAGFIIKDCLTYLYGSGFPKATDITKQVEKLDYFKAKQWNGYKSHALKPAYEPIIMAMKPNDGTYANNALKHGVSGLNIDASRIATDDNTGRPKGPDGNCYGHYKKVVTQTHRKGRYPANIILDEKAAELLDQQTGVLKSGELRAVNKPPKSNVYEHGRKQANVSHFNKSSGGASRFFYCAKASKAERNAGCEDLPEITKPLMGEFKDNPGRLTPKSSPTPRANHHPTVKPLKLMEYLIKLAMPPENGLLLDPFAGSGSTLVAAQNLGYKAEGIEMNEEYCSIALARLNNKQ